MHLRTSAGIVALVVVLVSGAQDIGAARRPLSAPPPPPPLISSDTRLLVVAPHPDDEVLGAGGLMQQVHAAGGRVRVVYLTDGDGFRDGVKLEERARRPTFIDYRGYGRRRQNEARNALGALGLDGSDARF